MTGFLIICRNEVVNFIRSDHSVFVVYAILLTVWSSVLTSNMLQSALEVSTLWWIFFSVVVSGNFTSTVFIIERMSGSLEIVLTCGVSRGAILVGKMLYVVVMSVVFGLICYALAVVWVFVTGGTYHMTTETYDVLMLVGVYTAASFLNAACGAWLSFRLTNPRLSQFATLLVLGMLVGSNAVLNTYTNIPSWVLPVVLTLTGTIFMVFAVRDFSGERVVQPFSF